MHNSEKWTVRGIGSEWNLPCFVTGQQPSEHDLKPNISGFVESREAGERVVAIFGGLARLDYRPREPNRIQVKVGVTEENKEALERLYRLVREAGNIITPQIVKAAKTGFIEPSPHEKFALTEPLLKQGLKVLCGRTWRIEAMMYMPTYDECVTAMSNNGWSHDSFVDLLDDLTEGRFKKSPDIFDDTTFDKTLGRALLTTLLPVQAIGQSSDGVSFMWPIKLMRLEREIEFDDAKLHERRKADFELGGGGPNTMAGALRFAHKVLTEGGVDFIRPDEDGVNILMKFSMGLHPKSPKLVDALIVEEQKKPIEEQKLNLADTEGNTALHYALREIAAKSEGMVMRKAQIARSLMTAGLDIFQENSFGQRPVDEITPKIAEITGLPCPDQVRNTLKINRKPPSKDA